MTHPLSSFASAAAVCLALTACANDGDVTAPAAHLPSTSALHAAASTGADLQVSGSASSASPNAGATMSYTFQVRNSGPADAAAVTLTDVLPSGTQYLGATVPAWAGLGGPIGCAAANDGFATTVTCTLGSMVKGGQATIVVAVSVPVTAGTFVNTGTVSSATADPQSSNNSATVSAQIKTNFAPGACALPAGQTTLHGIVMFTSTVNTASGSLLQDFAFIADNGVEYYVRTNFYDGSAPLTTVINLDCKQSPVQFISTGGSVTVTGTFGTDSVSFYPASLGIPPVPTFTASVVQVPTHKDKI